MIGSMDRVSSDTYYEAKKRLGLIGPAEDYMPTAIDDEDDSVD